MPVTRSQAAEAARGANRHGANRDAAHPVSRLPSHAYALADVVGALESADIPRLRAALDAADPALLNHPGPWRWYVDECFESSNYNGECFFETLYGAELMGDYPQTLLSCFTVTLVKRLAEIREPPPPSPFDPDDPVIAEMTAEDQEEMRRRAEEEMAHHLEWRERVRAHHDLHGPIDWWSSKDKDTWLKVYEVLVNHPKIDVNASRTEADLEAMSQTWSFMPKEQRPPLPTEQNGVENSLIDDMQTAWEYIFQHSGRHDSEADRAFHGQLLSILASTGKVDAERQAIVWAPQDYEKQQLGNTLESTMCWYTSVNMDAAPLHALLEHPAFLRPAQRILADEEYDRRDLWSEYGEDHFDFLDTALKGYVQRTQKVRVLARVRRIARVHIFLARWSADARLAAYAPDGAGAKRARKSFDATAAAAGW